MSWIDSHCHLHPFYKKGKIDEILMRASSACVDQMITVGTTYEDWIIYRELVKQYPVNINYSVGLHPCYVNKNWRQQTDHILKFWQKKPRPCALGEIGLDYLTEDAGERRLQREVFEKILSACAEAGDKVISIHSRRASDDVVSMLGSKFPGKAILHWFSGSVKNVEDAEGVYFSINPAMIRSRSGKKLIRAMDPAYLLTETDGPYVQVDDRDARPRDVKRVINWLAQEWGTNFDAAAERISKNWRR